MKASEVNQLNKSKNMSLELSLEEAMLDYCKGLTFPSPKPWFQLLNKYEHIKYSVLPEGEGEEESIAIVCFQATDEERQKSPNIRKLLKWIHS